VLEVIEKEDWAGHARRLGDRLLKELGRQVERHPRVWAGVRGVGMMIGLQLQPEPAGLTGAGQSPAVRLTQLLLEEGLLVIPAGTHVIRLLPPLNLSEAEAREGIEILERVVGRLD